MKTLALHNPFGAPVFHEETVSSTMDLSRALADQGKPHGTVITADFQEAGRGRIGRPWKSQRGDSLFFTILLHYADYQAVPQALTLKTGLAVSLAIEDFVRDRGLSFQEPVQVKWPNDVMIGSQKTAGILAEGDGKRVYIGIGVNLAQTEFPEALQGKATSIALSAGSFSLSAEDRFPLLETILVRLFQESASLKQRGWRTQLLERLYMRNKPVRFIPGSADSPAYVEGILQGIGPQGELVLAGETGLISFVTGELDVYGKRGQS